MNKITILGCTFNNVNGTHFQMFQTYYAHTIIFSSQYNQALSYKVVRTIMIIEFVFKIVESDLHESKIKTATK